MSAPGRALALGLLRWRRERQRRAALAASGAPVPTLSPRVTLARVIGNDLWPRHAQGQSLVNLGFILTHEPDFPGCTKLFVLNRLVDPAAQAQAEAMVTACGHDCLTLPFDAAAYRAATLDTAQFGGDGYFLSPAFGALDANAQDRARLWAAAPKLRYAMNVNGARNAALERGAARGDWTLLLDGSCFVSAQAWQGLRADLVCAPFAPYLVIPMQRLARNADALTALPRPNRREEPQLGFHASAMARFDETYPYGLRDKTSLLDRIGVPGVWNTWVKLPWLPESPPPPDDAHRWKAARVAVFRLSSGVQDGGLEQGSAGMQRYQSRNRAIVQTLALLDERMGHADRARTGAVTGVAAGSVAGFEPAGFEPAGLKLAGFEPAGGPPDV